MTDQEWSNFEDEIIDLLNKYHKLPQFLIELSDNNLSLLTLEQFNKIHEDIRQNDPFYGYKFKGMVIL